MARIYSKTVQKSLHDPNNHDGVITHLEPDILECEVKWALGSITMNKANSTDMNLSKLLELVVDREAWHVAVYGVTKRRTRLSNWNELIDFFFHLSPLVGGQSLHNTVVELISFELCFHCHLISLWFLHLPVGYLEMHCLISFFLCFLQFFFLVNDI